MITGVEYAHDRDGLKSAWLSDPDDFAGIVRATVSFAGWHTVEIAYSFQPGQPKECIAFTLKTSPDGPRKITPADMREISFSDLAEKVSPVASADQPARSRHPVDTDRLRRVAEIYTAADSGGSAIAQIRIQLNVSRSRAYGLVQQAREAGLITTEGTEE